MYGYNSHKDERKLWVEYLYASAILYLAKTASTISFSPTGTTKNSTLNANSSTEEGLTSTSWYPTISSVTVQIYDTSRTTLLSTFTLYFGSSC